FRFAGFMFSHPLVGERARLDIRKQPPHLIASRPVYDSWPASQIAVLRGVRYRITHICDPAFVDQIDDQLHLVKTFEVRHLGSVSRFDQGLESRLNQRSEAAA